MSKATIYRWWPNKAAVVTDSFLEFIAQEIHFENTASQKAKLRRQTHKLAQIFSGQSEKIIAALVAESQFAREVTDAFRSRWISVRREATKKVIHRGICSGEFRVDLDVEAAIDALYGPIYYRLLIAHLSRAKLYRQACRLRYSRDRGFTQATHRSHQRYPERH